MNEMISISEASKRLGIQRPTLSRLIKENRLPTKMNGKRKLICLSECQKMIQDMAAMGKLRVRKPKKTEARTEDQWKELYREMKQERDELKEQYRALESENRELQGAVKLLKSRESDETPDRKEIKTNILHKLGNALNMLSN